MPAKKLQFEEAVEYYLGIEQVQEEQKVDKSILDVAFIGKPFYCWDINKKGIDSCCFNHLIGLPQKNDIEHPLYEYEQEILDKLESKKHVWIKKSRGIGVTELILRYLTWKIVSTNDLDNKNIFIISGTKEEFANKLKERMEKLFDRAYPLLRLDSKFTELIINKTWIKVFPSKNIKGMRGYVDVAYIFIDESDFFEPIEQNELQYVIKSYEEKSKGQIIMSSTPNRPDGLFANIENNNAFGTGYFEKIFLDFRRGLGKIYDDEFIKREMNQPYFEREYNLKYLGSIGNVFSPTEIDFCIKQGDSLVDFEVNQMAGHPVGVDFGFNVSKSVICIGEWEPELQMLRVVEVIDFDNRPSTPSRVAEAMWNVYQKYGSNTDFFVDGANRGAVNECKVKFGESITWDKKEMHKSMKIHPINFGTEHKEMLRHMYYMVSKGALAIPSKQDRLLTAMRTAQAEDFDLDKDQTVNSDHIDACRLMTYAINYRPEQE